MSREAARESGAVMRRCRLALVALAAAAALVTHAEETPTPAPAPAAPTLPTPYSAEQIREVWGVGLRLEQRTVEGEQRSGSRMTVIASSAERVTVRVEPVGGTGEPRELSATWPELRDHALFPAATSTRGRATCRSGLGDLPGWRYTTPAEDGGMLTMCFADATPGPPVEYETTRDGALVSRTEHVSFQPGPPVAEAKSAP